MRGTESVEFADGSFSLIGATASKDDVARIASKFRSADILAFSEAFDVDGLRVDVLQADVGFEVGVGGIDALTDALGDFAEGQPLPGRLVQIL
ncbi:MAG: hypothetical protein P1U86_09340 [Verrucomicrobiales bacterium]|nr:hypothetical protein [Verrucomicrobiales bacterium]